VGRENGIGKIHNFSVVVRGTLFAFQNSKHEHQKTLSIPFPEGKPRLRSQWSPQINEEVDFMEYLVHKKLEAN